MPPDKHLTWAPHKPRRPRFCRRAAVIRNRRLAPQAVPYGAEVEPDDVELLLNSHAIKQPYQGALIAFSVFPEHELVEFIRESLLDEQDLGRAICTQPAQRDAI